MHQFLVFPQKLLVRQRCLWLAGHYGYYGRVFIDSNLPNVQIDDFSVRIRLQRLVYFRVQIRILRFLVEQNNMRIANQPISPLRNDGAADQTHNRIEPDPSEHLSAEQRDNSQNRGDSVCKNMNVSRLQVKIVDLTVAVIM